MAVVATFALVAATAAALAAVASLIASRSQAGLALVVITLFRCLIVLRLCRRRLGLIISRMLVRGKIRRMSVMIL